MLHSTCCEWMWAFILLPSCQKSQNDLLFICHPSASSCSALAITIIWKLLSHSRTFDRVYISISSNTRSRPHLRLFVSRKLFANFFFASSWLCDPKSWLYIFIIMETRGIFYESWYFTLTCFDFYMNPQKPLRELFLSLFVLSHQEDLFWHRKLKIFFPSHFRKASQCDKQVHMKIERLICRLRKLCFFDCSFIERTQHYTQL